MAWRVGPARDALAGYALHPEIHAAGGATGTIASLRRAHAIANTESDRDVETLRADPCACRLCGEDAEMYRLCDGCKQAIKCIKRALQDNQLEYNKTIVHTAIRVHAAGNGHRFWLGRTDADVHSWGSQMLGAKWLLASGPFRKLAGDQSGVRQSAQDGDSHVVASTQCWA